MSEFVSLWMNSEIMWGRGRGFWGRRMGALGIWFVACGEDGDERERERERIRGVAFF